MYPDTTKKRGEPLLVVEDLRIPGAVENFHLVAMRGQILCVAGQIGSGAAEALRAMAGLVPESTGRVIVNGRPLVLDSVPKALASNVMFISEDRAGEGIFLRLRVLDNLVATRLGEYSRGGILSWAALRSMAARLAERVGVPGGRLRAYADELSGGNQQKLAFARSLERKEPGVLLMNEPTRGVDVGARAEIYRLMQEFCDLGYALVMTSSDLEEVMGLSDVIVTMYRGRQVARYERGQATMNRVLSDITHPTTEAIA
jgi:ABC-type sugar transport system ATPase subunit